MKIEAENAEIFIGRNAGAAVYQSICNAAHSIKILSPYISPEYIELLLDAQKRGVAVLLLSESDMASRAKRTGMYEKILVQHRSVNGKAQAAKYIGMALCTALALGLLFLGYWGYKNGLIPNLQEIRSAGLNTQTVLAILLLVVGLSILCRWFLALAKKRIYRYRYTPKFDLSIFASPYEPHPAKKIKAGQFFIHSKIYVIDHRLAFVGSLNFTRKGFEDNYECCVKISDTDAVLRIAGGLEQLREAAAAFVLDLNEIGGSVFSEPPH